MIITLPARLQDDLKWEKEKKTAQEIIERGGSPFWDIDFGIARREIDFTDESLFLSLQIAIDQFVIQFKEELKQSRGVSLYRGSADFSRSLFWNGHHQQHFEEWLGSLQKLSLPTLSRGDQDHLFRVFSANLMGEYLHRLASLFPDDIPVFALADLEAVPRDATLCHLLSKERFAHLHLGVKGAPFPVSCFKWEGDCLQENKETLTTRTGICFPADEAYHPDIFSCLSRLIGQFQKEAVSFRIIPEEYLTESWDNLDTIYIVKDSLTQRGNRKLSGFKAAGGDVQEKESE